MSATFYETTRPMLEPVVEHAREHYGHLDQKPESGPSEFQFLQSVEAGDPTALPTSFTGARRYLMECEARDTGRDPADIGLDGIESAMSYDRRNYARMAVVGVALAAVATAENMPGAEGLGLGVASFSTIAMAWSHSKIDYIRSIRQARKNQVGDTVLQAVVSQQ